MATITASEAAAALEWLTECRVVDVDAGTASEPIAIAISEGRITSVGSPVPPEASPTSAGGAFVVPGLVGCHVHLQATYPYSARDPSEPPPLTAVRSAAHARRIAEAGVTTVRCVHEQSQADLHVRAAAERGWIRAPRIAAGGRALTAPGGHGDGLGGVVARGERAFEDAAIAELEAGADHVKIYASGGLARAGESLDEPELTVAEMRAVVRAAEAHGAYVVAHTASSASIRAGLEAGVRSFEHAYVLDAATARAMADAGVFLTPTLSVTRVQDWMASAGFERQSMERSDRMAEVHLESARQAIAAGVTIVAGTDFTPVGATGGTIMAVREVELLADAGLDAPSALRAATSAAADLLRWGHVGRIRPGSMADLLILDEDPTQSASALRTIRGVILGGMLISGRLTASA